MKNANVSKQALIHATAGLLAIACALSGPLFAQTDSRLEKIASDQDQKATELKADSHNRVERGFLWFQNQNLLDQFSTGLGGFRAKIGGLGPGAGLGLGPEFHRADLMSGLLSLRASAQVSFQGDRRFDLQLTAPRLGSGGRYFAEFYSVHHDYPRMNYYGSGPDSQKTGRTDYRMEDTALDATFGFRPSKRLAVGTSAGYVWNNVGHGTDPRYASAELVYSPSRAPGIDAQANFFRSGAFAQYDWRDDPGGPRSGGNYFAQFNDYRDRTLGVSNFQRLDLEAQQYVPVLNDRRVFALRAKSTLTYAGNQTLPFYMQPTLGGSDDLRGYRPYRFRGDNLMVMNAEYRWEVFSGMDMAVFGDAGQVFTKKSDLSFSNLESDLGFGLRFNARNKTFLRLDAAFSHEGFQVWIKFQNIFQRGPVHTSSNMGGF